MGQEGMDGLARYHLMNLLLVGVGTFVILVSFFLNWFDISSPAIDIILGGSVHLGYSGKVLLIGYPKLGLPGRTIVLLVPMAAFGALATSILGPKLAIRPLTWIIVQIALTILGTGYMFLLLIGLRDAISQIFQELLGSPAELIGNQFINIKPALGFWTTCLGFSLILAAALWTLYQDTLVDKI